MKSNNKDIVVDGIYCCYCDKKLATFLEDETLNPSCEELHKQGAVAVPNMGWLCSQECAIKFEKEFDVHFERNNSGIINYYPEL